MSRSIAFGISRDRHVVGVTAHQHHLPGLGPQQLGQAVSHGGHEAVPALCPRLFARLSMRGRRQEDREKEPAQDPREGGHRSAQIAEQLARARLKHAVQLLPSFDRERLLELRSRFGFPIHLLVGARELKMRRDEPRSEAGRALEK